MADLCSRSGLRKSVRVVKGGDTRTASVLAAAVEAGSRAELLAVHDGARPLIRPKEFDDLVRQGWATYAVAPAVAAVLWIFLFNPGRGLITHFLAEFGYDWNHAQNSGQAMFLVVFASVWKQISYNFLFFYAALQSIPRSLIEAAAIDGAGPIRRFFKIALPLIAPVSFFLLVVNLVYAFFDTFPVIDAATSGGPVQATTTLIYKIYREGFTGLDLASSAAQSVVLMFLVIVLTVVQFRYVESKVRYQ